MPPAFLFLIPAMSNSRAEALIRSGASLPRAGSGGLYGPPYSPSTPFFCAFCRRSQRTAKPAISSAEPGGLERLAAPLRPVSVSREWRHICACRNSVNTLFCTLCSTRCKSTGTAEFEAQAGLSRVACNPEFPAGPFRRRAASIPRSCFRQQPFCTSMRNKDSKAFSRILRAKRCLTEPIHTGPAMTEAFQMERTI